MATLPSFAAAWMRQRVEGDAAVASVEEAELAQLDDVAALAMSTALLGAVPLEAVSQERRATSGLVEQQRLFARARR